MEVAEILENKIPVMYARVSTEDQAETLKTQIASNKSVLIQKFGIDNIERIYSEQASGTDPKRPEWLAMIEWIVSQPKPEKYIVVLADFNRWSRQTFSGPEQAARLYRVNVHIVALQENAFTGTPKVPNPQGDLLFSVQMGFGAYGREVGRARTIAGVAESRKKGIISGTIKDLKPELPNFSFRRAYELMQEVERGERTWATANTALGIQRLNLTPAQIRKGQKLGSFSNYLSKKLKDFLEEVEEKLGADGLENYFKVTDKLVDLERKFGTGRNNKSNVKMWGVRRASSLYVGKPWEFVERTGEPLTVEDIDIHLENFEEYLPKRR